MDTEKDLNAKILDITMKIRENYPELSKYLEEMPETIPNEQSPEMELKSLRDYYESLTTLIKNYAPTHEKTPSPKE